MNTITFLRLKKRARGPTNYASRRGTPYSHLLEELRPPRSLVTVARSGGYWIPIPIPARYETSPSSPRPPRRDRRTLLHPKFQLHKGSGRVRGLKGRRAQFSPSVVTLEAGSGGPAQGGRLTPSFLPPWWLLAAGDPRRR
jgi:hypothetical protein